MVPKKILISVTSDLVSDQRVNRAATALHEAGHNVVLIGRELPGSPPVTDRPYQVKRFRLWFTRGPLFYANYNLRLLVYLMFHKADLVLSNDLDTLAPNTIAAWFKRIPLVYDSHEYFTGVPELVGRPFVKKMWQWIEKMCLPGADRMITVNESIAELYRTEYNREVSVIRNVPAGEVWKQVHDKSSLRKELGLPADKKLVVLQGAGINIQRGAEEAVEAMRFLDDTVLLVIGGGDVMQSLKQLVEKFGLQQKVLFKDRMPFSELIKYTASADLGLTLDKNTNLNYRFSLPNKLFDYIRAGIPILASRLPEVEKIINTYLIGDFIETHQPDHIAEKIRYMLSDVSAREKWLSNLGTASAELNWSHEKNRFLEVFNGLL